MWVNRKYSHFGDAVDSMRSEMQLSHGSLGRTPQPYWVCCDTLQPGRFLELTLCLERKKAGMQRRKHRSQREPMFRKEFLAGISRSVENAEYELGSSPNLRRRHANDTQVLPEMQLTHTLLQSLEAGDKTDWICLVCKLALTYFLNLWKMWERKGTKELKERNWKKYLKTSLNPYMRKVHLHPWLVPL